jgi:hypothetical protein
MQKEKACVALLVYQFVGGVIGDGFLIPKILLVETFAAEM